MENIPGKITLTSGLAIQTRRAQAVDPQLAAAIRRTCTANQHILACYLLDARRRDVGEIQLIIAVTLDDPSKMDAVAQQFQTMLQHFPQQARNTSIMSSATFVTAYAGSEFYSRNAR